MKNRKNALWLELLKEEKRNWLMLRKNILKFNRKKQKKKKKKIINQKKKKKGINFQKF